MLSKTDVECADQCSRKRAILFGLSALFFGVSSILNGHAFFTDVQAWSDDAALRLLWIIYAIVVALMLLTGGALLKRSEIRHLMNDDVSMRHRNWSLIVGFCAAIISAIGILITPQASNITATGAAFLVAATALFVSLAIFAILELRTTGDV
ncbi:MAG: hypothetical protein ACYDGM_05410 [Vulcanimicrobiaceae bacterium]